MNILTTDDISDGFRDEILDQASDFAGFAFRHRTLESSHLVGKVVATVFLEPSTRTRLSFETAALRMGAKVISVPDGKVSSLAKGESLYDTLMTVGLYADAIIVRTPESMSLSLLTESQLRRLPLIINAGDGSNHHPTQALLDAYTIKCCKGRLNNLKIGICGDLHNSRSIKSLESLLEGNTFFANNVCYDPALRDIAFDDFLSQLDVLYLNRVQSERDAHKNQINVWRWNLNKQRLSQLNTDAIIMNPGPRLEEMPEEFDHDPRVVYWEQMKNGLYVRMALLSLLFEPS